VTLRVLLPIILVGTLAVQALRPAQRLVAVLGGAALSCLASTLLGGPPVQEVLAQVPWDVLVILVSLGALSQVLAESRLFQRIAVAVARASRGDPRRLSVVVAVTMFVVSGLVNNLTALLLVLPVVLVLLRLIAPTQRYVAWTLGLMLVACNLGGAATPIGDFPAILLLGAGRMTFIDYLIAAAPVTAVALLALLLLVVLAVRPTAKLSRDPLSWRITLRVAEAMHRGVRVETRTMLPALLALAAMVLGWTALPASLGVSPELVAWLGAVVALTLVGRAGETIARRSVDAEALLFLLALFVMVGAVRATGLFEASGQWLLALPLSPELRLVVFLVAAAVLTGLFSAGPSMAALLEVADVLARDLPGRVVYVGLALSVCAGSSLFLTAATSGPLAQALVDRADLKDAAGNKLSLGFREFAPVGALCFTVILCCAVVQALLGLAAAGR
jgi:Na+/H+ antiporter NhaD/arsenite permease-like protein